MAIYASVRSLQIGDRENTIMPSLYLSDNPNSTMMSGDHSNTVEWIMPPGLLPTQKEVTKGHIDEYKSEIHFSDKDAKGGTRPYSRLTQSAHRKHWPLGGPRDPGVFLMHF